MSVLNCPDEELPVHVNVPLDAVMVALVGSPCNNASDPSNVPIKKVSLEFLFSIFIAISGFDAQAAKAMKLAIADFLKFIERDTC